MTLLSKFTKERNWFLTRVRGSLSVFSTIAWYRFSPELQEDAENIRKQIVLLDRKLTFGWPEQKAYFHKKFQETIDKNTKKTENSLKTIKEMSEFIDLKTKGIQ